jgi:hypothetical protein
MPDDIVLPPLPPTIDLGTVRLRGLRPDDAAALLACLGDPFVIEHTSYPVQDAASVAAFIEGHRRGYAERSSCRWALARASDDRLIGTRSAGLLTAERRVGGGAARYRSAANRLKKLVSFQRGRCG